MIQVACLQRWGISVPPFALLSEKLARRWDTGCQQIRLRLKLNSKKHQSQRCFFEIWKRRWTFKSEGFAPNCLRLNCGHIIGYRLYLLVGLNSQGGGGLGAVTMSPIITAHLRSYSAWSSIISTSLVMCSPMNVECIHFKPYFNGSTPILQLQDNAWIQPKSLAFTYRTI